MTTAMLWFSTSRRSRSGSSSSASRTSSSKSESSNGSRSMNSVSSGSTATPSRASRSARRTTCSKSASDSGSRESALRRPMSTNPPNTTAATAPTTANVSTAFTTGSVLQPPSATTAESPTQSATAAANAIRRAGGTPPTVALAPHRAGDHDPLDLVRALVDLGDLRVAHHPLHWVLVDVAVAAEDLHRLDRHGHRGVRGEQLRHRGPLAETALAAVGDRARLVEQLAGGGGPRLHVGELELDALEVVDRRAERDALLRVLVGVVGRALRDPDRLRRGAQPRPLEHGQRHRVALALGADHVRGRHAHVLEDRRARRRALDPELVLELRDAEARAVLLDDERAHPGPPVIDRRPGEQDVEVGDRRVRDPVLRAGDDPLVAVAHRGRPQGGGVRAGLGLGQAERRRPPAGRAARQEALLELV